MEVGVIKCVSSELENPFFSKRIASSCHPNLTRNLSRHVKENITSSYQKQETSYDDVITLKRKWLTILKGFFSQACIYNLLKHTGAEQLLLGWSETASIRESIPSSPVCYNIYILSSVCTLLIRQGFALNPVYEYFITRIVKIRTLFRINKQHFIALGWRNPLISYQLVLCEDHDYFIQIVLVKYFKGKVH